MPPSSPNTIPHNLLQPRSGKILFNGDIISSSRMSENTFGLVQQKYNNQLDITVEEYIVLGRAPYLNLFDTPKQADYLIVQNVMEMMNISSLYKQLYSRLSGGEAQLVQIAKVICQNPAIILLDEPTCHLDFGNQFRVNELIKKLSSQGYIVIFTTHNPNHAFYFNSKVGVFTQSGEFLFGDVADVLTEKLLSAIYHIEVKLLYDKFLDRKICITL